MYERETSRLTTAAPREPGSKRKMLVTGGSGLVGSYFLQHISNKGYYDIYATSHDSPVSHVKNIPLDLAQTENVFVKIKEIRPEIIVNLAALTDVDGCEVDRDLAIRLNRDLVSAISKYVYESKTSYLLHVSTDYIFDGNDGNYTEESQTNPINWYGATKLQGENEIISKILEKDWCIARTSTPFGLHRKKQSFPLFVIQKLRRHENINVLTDQFTSPTYAKSLARTLVEIIEQRFNGIIHTSGKSRLSRYEQALKICRRFDLNEELLLEVTSDKMKGWKARRPKDSSLNVSKANQILENKPECFDHSLEQFGREINFPTA